MLPFMYKIMLKIQEYLLEMSNKEYIMSLNITELGYIEFTPKIVQKCLMYSRVLTAEITQILLFWEIKGEFF